VTTVTAAKVGRASGTVPCATCSSAVDPLRAARVAVFAERFRYFCSAGCRERYDPNLMRTPIPQLRTPAEARSPSVPLPAAAETGEAASAETEPSPQAKAEPAQPEESEAAPVSSPGSVETASVGSLLLVLAALAGALSIALALSGDSRVALSARLVLVVVAACALSAETCMGQRDPTEQSRLSLLSAPLLSLLASGAAYFSEHSASSSAITLAALVIALCAGGVLLIRRARRPSDAERGLIRRELDGPARRLSEDEISLVSAGDLRPGEEIVVEAGETFAADATVTAGTALVLPWLGATGRTDRREGDVLVAGAQVVEGSLRAVVNWAGYDRAWARLSTDPRRRADLHAPLARSGRLVSERVAPFVTGAAVLAGLATGLDWLELTLLAVAVHAALTGPVLSSLSAILVARAVFDGLRRGIAYQNAQAFDRAGKISTLAFCARGTLLLGEPEVATIEAFGDHRAEEVLALVAGAEGGGQNAVSTSILRAARARGIRPDGVRSPIAQPGLGTTAVASSGQPLIVGSRALMLKEHVSVAAAERRVGELEAMGRMVLWVALGGRLIGLLGLQDGLRPGARAAVQHVLDVGIEPVLLSGDARETCEALGRALDVEHVRPEVPPAERGDEIRRLADGGAVTAVAGHSPGDDVALAAANVSIALSSAGSTSSEWSVQLASDDVRDAAYAIRLAHDTRRDARTSLLFALAPAAVASVVAALGLAGPLVPPLAAAFGGLAALLRLRSQA
jgi:cation transport ATPase